MLRVLKGDICNCFCSCPLHPAPAQPVCITNTYKYVHMYRTYGVLVIAHTIHMYLHNPHF